MLTLIDKPVYVGGAGSAYSNMACKDEPDCNAVPDERYEAGCVEHQRGLNTHRSARSATAPALGSFSAPFPKCSQGIWQKQCGPQLGGEDIAPQAFPLAGPVTILLGQICLLRAGSPEGPASFGIIKSEEAPLAAGGKRSLAPRPVPGPKNSAPNGASSIRGLRLSRQAGSAMLFSCTLARPWAKVQRLGRSKSDPALTARGFAPRRAGRPGQPI